MGILRKVSDKVKGFVQPKKKVAQRIRRIGRLELSNLLKNNVCEIVFIRRRPERAPGRPVIRKMICSNSMEILNSENGIRSLNFHLPRGPRRLDEAFHDIVVVWDILVQDYRNVSMEDCFLTNTISPEEFWDYYNKVLLPMSPNEKLQYMDTV
jgi:WD40 repeat protein